MSSEYNAATAFLQQLATDARVEASLNANRIWALTDPQSDRPALREPWFGHRVGTPDLGPKPTLSSMLSPNDKFSEWLARLDSGTDEWIARFFPAVDACFKELPEEFLCGVISGVKPFGLDATVFELVWQRARDRSDRASRTESARVMRDADARGWTLPQGSVVAQLSRIREQAQDQLGEVNREQAIKDAEIRLELLKFAEEQALNHKRGMLAVLADNARLLLSIPNDGIAEAQLRLEANRALYDALGKYYDVDAMYEELRLKAEQARVGIDIDVSRNRIDAARAVDGGGKAAALGQAVRGFSDMVSQAAQGAGSLVARIESI